MRKPNVVIAVLGVLLLLSNAAWLYNAVDAGVSHTHLTESYRQARGAALECFAATKAAAEPGATRDSIIAAARADDRAHEPFEKDGFLWVGYTGLRFDRSGRLLEIAPSVEPF